MIGYHGGGPENPDRNQPGTPKPPAKPQLEIPPGWVYWIAN
jgi:hypothetical protein